MIIIAPVSNNLNLVSKSSFCFFLLQYIPQNWITFDQNESSSDLCLFLLTKRLFVSKLIFSHSLIQFLLPFYFRAFFDTLAKEIKSNNRIYSDNSILNSFSFTVLLTHKADLQPLQRAHLST